MDGKQIISIIDYLFQWITRFAVLNGLWVLFSLIGFLVGGIFPSTVATLSVARKWIMNDTDFKVWDFFKESYKKEFVTSNILGWILLAIGLIFYINYQAILGLTLTSNTLYQIMLITFLLLLFFYVIVIIWAFPLIAHYDTSVINIIKSALIIGLSKIHFTVAIGLYLFTVMYLSFAFPGAILFFTFSAASYGCMWLSLRVFSKVKNIQHS
ncbi:YesL family protein [Neobacillus sp. NPDC058068]|uniref:YesL family protein n=1 Tax=Neobacillus sp. NPDC058068 TaxID=3346325 RepID=UPI0036DF1723